MVYARESYSLQGFRYFFGACPRLGVGSSLGCLGGRGPGSRYSLPFPAGPARAQTGRSIPKLFFSLLWVEILNRVFSKASGFSS